jgi:hypothetical protein
MILEDGPLYTPEQVSENRWLGKRSADALRKAASRGQLQHTLSGGQIHFHRVDILANQEEARVLAKKARPLPVSAPRRGRRAPTAAATVPSGVSELRARPEARRRKAS